MKNLKIQGRNSKISARVFASTLMLVFAILLAGIPASTAHTPPISVPTYAYVQVSPNPVGVNESVFIVMWLHGAPPTAAGIGGDRYHDFWITIYTPRGNVEKFGPYISDPTGSTFMKYVPKEVGKYTIVFNYTGQVISLYHPKTGIPGQNSIFINDTWLPSSATTTLTVQEEPIPLPPTYPLPTSYWTRPIEGQNTEWAKIASNWLGGAHISSQGAYETNKVSGVPNLWQKDGTAPGSPHIVWTKPIEFGGVVGGTTEIPGVTFYSGGSYEGRFTNAIIMFGRLYFPLPLGHSGTGGGYVCIELRTGEEVWRRSDIGTYKGWPIPIKGQLFNYESMNQHGVVGGVLWAVVGTQWVAYDAFTGMWMYNLTNVPNGYEVYTNKGEIVRYVLNYEGRWLALWNNTQDNVGLHGGIGTGSSAYQWRPKWKSVDMSKAYTWNVTIHDLPGNAAPSIWYVIPGDLILGTSSNIKPGVGDKYTPDPFTVWALSDKPETRGDILWIKNYTAPAGNLTRRLGPVDPVNRVWLMFDVETMAWLGYSLDNGEPLWGPVGYCKNDFSYYGSGEGGGQRGFTAYGNLYTQGYGGELFAISCKNGSLLWKYSRNSGLNTPWGNYPIFIAAIAYGKVYAFNNEHSPNAPYYKDYRVSCIDAFNGNELWTIMGWAGQTGGRGLSTSVLAEGFLVYYNYYDNQVYCLGKGRTATVLSASPKVVAKGSSVLIEGSVTDLSPSVAGTPCVADESMGGWMEYLVMQKPMPQNVKGVTVELYAIAEDGSSNKIGEATTDPLNGGIFSILWTPPEEGTYVISAVFGGSESYWDSYASTAVGVTAAPPEAATAEQAGTLQCAIEALQPWNVVLTVLVAIAIIIGAANLYALRKRK
ncbi:MAG: PQQ-binding-like beta-propeller repeat protein [Candidatus Bathyarchaeia archaeon]